MCDPITATIIAASAAASTYNTVNTARKQDRALADQIRNQSKARNEANSRTRQQLDQMEGQSAQAHKDKAAKGYADILKANAPAARANLTAPGAVSDAFKEAGAEAAMGITQSLDRTSDQMATIDSASGLRRAEGVGRNDLAVDLGLISDRARGQNYLDEMRVRSIQRNPWLDALSQIGMAYAGARMPGAGMADGMAGAANGLGNVSTIGAGLAGSSRWAPNAVQAAGGLAPNPLRFWK